MPQAFVGSGDDVRRIELRHPCVASGDPAKDVDNSRVGKTAIGSIREYFKQGMVQDVFVVIDVRFHEDAIHAIHLPRIVFMECQLNVRFAELNLLVAGGGPWMKETGVDLTRELSMQ